MWVGLGLEVGGACKRSGRGNDIAKTDNAIDSGRRLWYFFTFQA